MPNWICDDSANISFEQNEDHKKFNLLFSCPPYYNLETYSNDPNDLSMKTSYSDFLDVYREIIRKSCLQLCDDSFAVFVVGEVREDGNYVGLVGDTVSAFKDAGMDYYNEMILLQEPATAAMRAERYMNSSRKIAKCHQNVLVFTKGSPKAASERMGKFDDAYIEYLK